MQVWLLPMAGGEAQPLTDLPEDVGDLAWSPDGVATVRRLGGDLGSAGRAAPPPKPASRRDRDVRLIDELGLPAQRRRLHLRASGPSCGSWTSPTELLAD